MGDRQDRAGGGSTGQARALPPDIGPTRAVNWVMGIGLILFAWLLALPVMTTIRHGGLDRLSEWPDAFFLFALLAVGFLGLGLRLIFFSKPWTGTLRFHPGGFTIRVETPFAEREHRYQWSEVTAFGREDVSNHRSFFIRRAGERPRAYSTILFASPGKALLARLHASAVAEGYRLDTDGLNLFIYEKKVWTVERGEQTDDTT